MRNYRSTIKSTVSTEGRSSFGFVIMRMTSAHSSTPHGIYSSFRARKVRHDGFGHVRVDLYNIKKRVYFGELTFTTKAGKLKFDPDHWDLKLGEKWDLALDR